MRPRWDTTTARDGGEGGARGAAAPVKKIMRGLAPLKLSVAVMESLA